MGAKGTVISGEVFGCFPRFSDEIAGEVELLSSSFCGVLLGGGKLLGCWLGS